MDSELLHGLAQAQALAKAVRAFWGRKGTYAGGMHTLSQKGEGVQWSDIRSYQYGDEVKWISWKHSARSPHQVWVKTFEVERAHRFVMLLDRRKGFVQGVLQNRFHRAWWMQSVLSFMALHQKDLCYWFQSDHPSPRLQLLHLHKDAQVTHQSLDMYHRRRVKPNPMPLHAQLLSLNQRLKRFTSVVVLTDGYDTYEHLYDALKVLSRHHEVNLILYPDIFQVSEDFTDLCRQQKWRFFCNDPETEKPYLASAQHMSEEWQKFWFETRLPKIKVTVCRPEESEMSFAMKVLRLA
jgi:uncharacterized protein (DUF58 family)